MVIEKRPCPAAFFKTVFQFVPAELLGHRQPKVTIKVKEMAAAFTQYQQVLTLHPL
jgi:hypothetical protein